MTDVLSGLSMLFTLSNFMFINIGVFIGIIFGGIPGLGIILAIVLFTPMTFGLNATPAILMLLGIYCGGTYGGSISAILINTPGTPNSAATLIDGHPAAKKGYAQKALDMSLYASTISGIISAILLIISAPQIAKVTLLFGPPEFFSLAFFGLAIIITVSSASLLKGIISGCIGMFIATIGLDPISGVTSRFTFGKIQLMSGIDMLILLIGLFAITEIISKSKLDDSKGPKEHFKLNAKERLSLTELRKSLKTIIRSSLLGTGIGAVPGTGGVLAAFLSYDLAKKNSKNPEKFGHGDLDGIAAPEAGNNGITGATLIPLFTLGIPGDGVTAILLGALMIHGLIPGPNLFANSGEIVFSIMFGLILINIFMLIQGRVLSKFFAKIVDIPYAILVPIVIVFCTAGSFSVRNSSTDLFIMIIVGILAYLILKMGFSLVPILLGVVLEPIAEHNFRNSLVMSQGSPTIFFTRPISLLFIVLALSAIGMVLIKKMKKKSTKEKRKEISNEKA